MSVLLETSLGDVVIDLYTAEAPRTSDNFLKLCLIKFYNDCTLHVRPTFIQTADTPHTSTPPASIHHLIALTSPPLPPDGLPLPPPPSRFLPDEFHPSLSHSSKYVVSMLNLGLPHTGAAHFFITTTPHLTSLDATHSIFGRVAEGFDVVDRIAAQPTDDSGRPVAHIRIRHTTVLEDPFPTPPSLLPLIPPTSPPPIHDPYDYESLQSLHRPTPSSPSSSSPPPPPPPPPPNPHAVVLEMIGDLPSADTAPPDNVLFVCKLNPVTRADDLELIFARFGRVVECVVVRDREGSSLCYGFVEFEKREECEAAYMKMDGVVVDDRRIRVDFSQSVSRQWKLYRQGKRATAAAAGRAAAPAGAATAPAVGGTRWGGRVVEDAASRASRWGGRIEGGGGKRDDRDGRREAARRDERKDERREVDGERRGRDEDERSGRGRKEERVGREGDRGAGDAGGGGRRERSRSRERRHRSHRSREREDDRASHHHKHRHHRSHSSSRSRSPRRR